MREKNTVGTGACVAYVEMSLNEGIKALCYVKLAIILKSMY